MVFYLPRPMTGQEIDKLHDRAGIPRPRRVSSVEELYRLSRREAAAEELALLAKELAGQLPTSVEGEGDDPRPQPLPSDPRALLTRAQVATMLGCSTRQVDRLLLAGDLPFIRPRPGGRRLIERREVEAFIRRREQAR